MGFKTSLVRRRTQSCFPNCAGQVHMAPGRGRRYHPPEMDVHAQSSRPQAAWPWLPQAGATAALPLTRLKRPLTVTAKAPYFLFSLWGLLKACASVSPASSLSAGQRPLSSPPCAASALSFCFRLFCKSAMKSMLCFRLWIRS